MKTKVIKIDADNIKRENITEITNALKNGKLVVFPTETVYGLGANGLDETACKNIFNAKGRPGDNPLILHIAEISQLDDLVEDVSESARDLIDMFWPGPLTMIFKKSSKIPDVVSAGLDTVAVRMPSHKIAREILKDCMIPIAAPSANLSGKPSPTSFKRVFEDLDNKVDIIVDGGRADVGIESTVVDMTVNPPMILRPGKVTTEDLKIIIPDIKIDSATIDSSDGKIPKSPGQKYKHYAPRAEAYCFVGNLDNVVKEINKRISENKNLKIGVLATEETKDYYIGAHILINLGSRENMSEIASNLFEALRECDDEKVDYIYTEGFELRGIGVGIMNRLLKACGGRVIFGL
ncbi:MULTISPECIES: L-threonylcarbamoyladenylate synthase [Peptoniphilus]|uniref:L-threonylcarbamoyladenylate synthase n=1 Tax=Peptoniphilus TaxID=162289 RepID=UPI0001DA99C3|nr:MULTISPECIES: L-threonylcarbamoyladenylate synthase [Peptoniphilus]EFI41757.1 Sua5/YciO/YrdC/YwlC family protein [Peptoniphilus sp. oral taxon 386 str. F0131]